MAGTGELSTSLNISPIWDDWTANNDYYRILFRGSTAIQARELTQLQTILQNQISSAGDNLFTAGTIIKGCAFTFDSSYYYIKIRDLRVDGQPVSLPQFANTIIQNSANVTAIVVDSATGLESLNPNLNTLYIKYTSTGANNQQLFLPSDVLNIYDRNYGVHSIATVNGGTGYSNLDSVTFTSSTGTGANATIQTNSLGTIINVTMAITGNNYFTNPTVSIANTTGGTANGSSAVITANNLIAQVTVAPTSFQTGNTDFNTVGTGYAFRISDGIIYQKGFFSRVDKQSIIVSKYDIAPDQVSVGFVTNEAIVNNSVDPSLNDNAQGTTNYNAPGAYRLRLTPVLSLIPTANIASTNNFFSIVDWQLGQPVRQNQSTQYSTLGKAIAQTASDQAGNYVINPFLLTTADISGNTTYLQSRISAGVAYVNGYKITDYNTSALPLRKGTDVVEKDNVNIATNYGDYTTIYNMQGVFPFNQAITVSLRDTIGSTPTSPAGAEIGTAVVNYLQYASGTAGSLATNYYMYFLSINMYIGKSFSSVQSVYYNGGGSPLNGAANLVLTNGLATLQDTAFSTMLFSLGQTATKTLRNLSGNNNNQYTYTTVNESLSFAANGILQKNLTGSDTFPYSGILNSIQEGTLIIVAAASVNTASTAAGTVAVTSSSNAIIGTSTSFLTYYNVNDWVQLGTTDVRQISTIANNTYLTLTTNAAISNTSTSHQRTYPVNIPIALYNNATRSANVSANGSVLSINLGESLANSLPVSVTYNIQRQGAVQLTKNLLANNYVKISVPATANTAATAWCLGVTDGITLNQVLITSNSNYTTGAADVTSNFIIDSGQKDTYYGLSYLRVNPANPITITNEAYLLVNFQSFSYTNTGGGIGFFDVDSYPVDDTGTANAQISIKTQQIPVYKTTSGQLYDLRDTLDFRPVVQNTANTTSNTSLATVNPSAVESFSAGEKYFPAPNQLFSTSIQHYLGRSDILTLNSLGQFTSIEGVPSDTPVAPLNIGNAMTIASISVPPYPTLSTPSGVAYNRSDYAVTMTPHQNRRYTMSDVGSLDARIQNLEYYTSLNLLEQQASSLLITNSSGLNRFKNGIFVDSFDNYTLADVTNSEFTAGIDEVNSMLIPKFRQQKHDLQVASSNNVNISNNVATLSYTTTTMVAQPYATRVRNCSDNFWNFTGTMSLTPNYDSYFETRVSPVNTLNVTNSTSPGALASSNNINTSKPLNISPVSTVSISGGQPLGGGPNYNRNIVSN